MKPFPIDILTPQGYLSEIHKKPNLNVAMNLFKIPRAFSVSGFGDWSVGRHSFCVAILALYWAQFRGYDEATRNRLVVMGLTHDFHEAATGDILPALKNEELRERLDQVQDLFLQGLNVKEYDHLKVDLKILDILAFLYEIQQAQTLNVEQKETLEAFSQKQRKALETFCAKQGVTNIQTFISDLEVFKS